MQRLPLVLVLVLVLPLVLKRRWELQAAPLAPVLGAGLVWEGHHNRRPQQQTKRAKPWAVSDMPWLKGYEMRLGEG
ncbi:hypothetical protein AA105894_1653 [Asaia spathodeae NBRC 105894]|nr:hypothetical protein AA105894_1653 [Asaia spathodeae NBRC 105894]